MKPSTLQYAQKLAVLKAMPTAEQALALTQDRQALLEILRNPVRAMVVASIDGAIERGQDSVLIQAGLPVCDIAWLGTLGYRVANHVSDHYETTEIEWSAKPKAQEVAA